jgi:hypothetical protein
LKVSAAVLQHAVPHWDPGKQHWPVPKFWQTSVLSQQFGPHTFALLQHEPRFGPCVMQASSDVQHSLPSQASLPDEQQRPFPVFKQDSPALQQFEEEHCTGQHAP